MRTLFFALASAGSWGAVSAQPITLTEPLDYQVVQRDATGDALVPVAGQIEGGRTPRTLEVRLKLAGEAPGKWRALVAEWEDSSFRAQLRVPGGGWHRIELRSLNEAGAVEASATAEHVGVGEIFVVAGQSNSANHGEERQKTRTGMAATFTGERWQLAHDPQPGASGRGGSFLPPLGDALVERFGVPIGFVACGIGATSVREWLPEGATFPNPPTIESRVRRRPDGNWESKGEAYASFVRRVKGLGERGFRAVLWHQGESDANQRDVTRTLAGELYARYLQTLICESRRVIGWDAPWFVAQVSYHVPGDEASPEIRAAQASLWKKGIALEGPDSDALKGALRERGGEGVHFSAAGLREHGKRWAEKVSPWLEAELGRTIEAPGSR